MVGLPQLQADIGLTIMIDYDDDIGLKLFFNFQYNIEQPKSSFLLELLLLLISGAGMGGGARGQCSPRTKR